MDPSTSTASMAPAVVSSHTMLATDVPTDFSLMLKMAEELSKAETGFVPVSLRGKPGDLLAMMFRARALDIPLAVAFDQLYITKNGTVGQLANLARALARRAGHRLAFPEYDRFHAVCLIQCRGETTPHEVQFTMQEAVSLGLTYTTEDGKGPGQNYVKQPQNMMIARVTMRAIRMYCPEVLMGMGGDQVEDDDEIATLSVDSDTIQAVRKEHQDKVTEILRLLELTDKQPNGAVRLNLQRELFVEARDGMVLDFAADPSGEYSVRNVFLEKMREADGLSRGQAAGTLPTADAAQGPADMKALRKLLEPDPAPEQEQAAAGAEEKPKATARKRAAKKAPSKPPAAPEADAGGEAAPAPRRARKKTAKSAEAPAPVAAPADQAPAADAAPQATTAPSPAGRAPGRAAGRPGGRGGPWSERPKDTILPCGCPVDFVVSTGKHADTCQDKK